MTRAVTGPATLVRRALGGHAALGLLAGALLYVIALTGSVIVVHDRWQRWEQPAIAEFATLSPASAQRAVADALGAGRGGPRTSHLYLRLPTRDLPRATVTTDQGGWYVDAAGRRAGREAHEWTDFLVALHEYLHLPATWGLILVGALGVVLTALAMTGIVAHPRIVRDAFRLRIRHDAQVARADWHNRLGVWTLPFAVAVAITGAFLGLGSIGAGMLARAYTGGDVTRVYAGIFGAEPVPNAAAAPVADVAAALATLAARAPRAIPTYVIVHDPGTRGQRVQLLAEHPRRLIYGESYAFDGRGAWLGTAGLADGALGKQAAASAYNLHFGNFGGPAVEIAYTLLGLALCVVTATGTTLWLGKRRRRGFGSDRLEACWRGVIWGTPLALVATAWLRWIAGSDAPFAAAFWLSLAASQVIAVARPRWIRDRPLRLALAVALVVTGVVHAAVAGPWTGGGVPIDAALVATGLTILAVLRLSPERSGRAA